MITKMKYKMKKQWLISLLCVCISMFTACKDDALYDGEYGPEGEPVTVSLKWVVPEMDVRTRAAMSDEDAAKVNDLWVGIYNATTGKCTYNHLYKGLSSTDEHKAHLLSNIQTRTGNSYIVAVANAMTNFGVSDGEENIEVEGYNREKGEYVPLHLLLEKADTWKKYLSISNVLVTPTNVELFTADLVMNGVFHETDTHDGLSWTTPKPVNISKNSSSVNLGYIHLQRLIAYNKFTIKAGDNVTVEPVSWQVHNNPVMSYLQEREGDDNSADVSTYFAQREGYSTNHSSSNPSYRFEAVKSGEYVFDFYQYENKQTAIDYVPNEGNDYVGINPDNTNLYADREREFKAVDGTNTGVYKSLCTTAEVGEIKPGGRNVKNFASYVTFRARVTYYVSPMPVGHQIPEGSGYSTPEDDWAATAEPVDPTETDNAMLRTGYATYTIHLGYCEEKDANENPTLNTAKDFHCRRNTKYDYTVTINGLKNVVVEAIKGTEENNPGAEGDVTDAGQSQVIELDAHYAVFNIKLSNQQRHNLRWRINTPYGNTTHTLKWPENAGEEPGDPTSDVSVNRKNKFYNWIRFKPAPSDNLYAIYRESNLSPEEADAALWTLEDLRDVEHHPGIDGGGIEITTDIDNTELHNYTVFVNEHVYEDSSDETGTNWKNYVDIGDRTVWLNTDIYHESSDKESVYMQSQYMITQKSIQTYYNRYSEGLKAILGMEYENESYGLNLRWDGTTPTPNRTFTDGNGDQITMENRWNVDNGRWNEWYYLSTDHTIINPTGKNWNGDNGILKNVEKKGNKTFIPQGVSPAIIDRQNENKPETNPAVYALRPFSTATDWERDTDPTKTHEYYDILSVCMNRNRDLNGNGRIDKEELRWYLPASGKYLRMILGRHSMKTPLMDYDGTSMLYYGAGSASNTRYHYATSDKIILWAEEGVSTSDIMDDNEEDTYSLPPWQVRCVRNLGVNLNKILNHDPVQQAYQLDKENDHIVVLEYYDASSIRGSVAGYLQAHTINQNTNMVAKRFEYAREDCNSTNTTVQADAAVKVNAGGVLSMTNHDQNVSYIPNWITSVNANQICGQYAQETDGRDRGTWRVPNQKELTIMRRLNIFKGKDKWMSCTQEYYGVHRFFGVSEDRSTVGDPGGDWKIRCVRDVVGQ